MSLYPEEYLDLAANFLFSHSVDFTGDRLLLTGGSGFVGSWIIDLLTYYTKENSQSIEILGISRNLKATHKKLGRRNFESINWIEGGIEKISETKFQFSHAVHAATPTTIETGYRDTSNLAHSSLGGMKYILERAQLNGNHPRILHTSSGSVYGNSTGGKVRIPLQQNLGGIKIESYTRHLDYSIAKRNTEIELNEATKKGFVSGLNARLFAFYGPGLPTTSHYAIGNLVDQAIHSHKLTLNGNGMATRSYMPGNVMAAVILYALKTNIEGATHIGSSEGRTLGHWAELVASVAGKEFDILGTFDDSNDKYVPENDARIPSINFTQNPREVLTDWIAYLAPN